MGKTLAASPVNIPIRINSDDRFCISVTEEINKGHSTKSRLSDKKAVTVGKYPIIYTKDFEIITLLRKDTFFPLPLPPSF